MNARTEISDAEIHRYTALARRLRAEAYTGALLAVARGIGRLTCAALSFTIGGGRAIAEHARRLQRRRATIQGLSGLSDHTLKDIGLRRANIRAAAEAVSRPAQPSRPGAIYPLARLVAQLVVDTPGANDSESATTGQYRKVSGG